MSRINRNSVVSHIPCWLKVVGTPTTDHRLPRENNFYAIPPKMNCTFCYSTGSLSYRHRAHEKPASRRNLLPSHLQRMLRFSQIRSSLSSPTHTYVIWSKYGACLLPIHGEIRPRSCLPRNASAILGCPNLEIQANCQWLGCHGI